MSTHVVPDPDGSLNRYTGDLGSTPLGALRAPTEVTRNAPGDSLVFTYTPDLSAAESSTFDAAIGTMRSGTGLNITDYQAIRTQMQTLRAMRQLGRNAYVGLTEAERNRQTYDCLVAITEIFLKLTREV